MQFKKLSTPSLKELFVSELENKILSGELKVGEKLPSERELADSMQVSRAVVNSGIAEMEQKGFLIVRPRVGTFVEDYRKNGTLETFNSIMKYNGGNLARNEIKAILELRIVLVNLAASLAIDNATDQQLESLLPILDDISVDDSSTMKSPLSVEMSCFPCSLSLSRSWYVSCGIVLSLTMARNC